MWNTLHLSCFLFINANVQFCPLLYLFFLLWILQNGIKGNCGCSRVGCLFFFTFFGCTIFFFYGRDYSKKMFYYIICIRDIPVNPWHICTVWIWKGESYVSRFSCYLCVVGWLPWVFGNDSIYFTSCYQGHERRNICTIISVCDISFG